MQPTACNSSLGTGGGVNCAHAAQDERLQTRGPRHTRRGSCVAGKPGEHELGGLDVSSTVGWYWLFATNPAFSWQKYTIAQTQKTAECAVGFSVNEHA